LLALALAPGCGVRNSFRISGSGDFAATPGGPSAVLSVVAAPCPGPKSIGMEWGSMNTRNPDQRFAEFIAHAAREDGGMQVLLPFDVTRKLKEAKLDPTLQPEPDQLPNRAQALGCSSYLTAELACWRYSYVFFVSSAELEYRLACRRADTGQVVWEADVLTRARNKSDRDLARQALAGTFEWLREQQRDQPDPEPERPG
jgi:hypothetical protein